MFAVLERGGGEGGGSRLPMMKSNLVGSLSASDANSARRTRKARRVIGAKSRLKRMAKNETGDLHVVVASGGIVVTMPGTDFLVIYTKPENTPWLMVTKLEDDRTDPSSKPSSWPAPGSLPTTRHAS